MKNLSRLIIPFADEMFLYTALSIGLLFATNAKRLFEHIANNLGVTQTLNITGFSSPVREYLLNLENKINPSLVDFSVWLIIGLFCITAVIIFQNLMDSTLEEADIAKNINNEYYQRLEKRVLIYKIIIRFSGIVMLVIWLRFFLVFIFSFLSDWFLRALLTLPSIKSIALIPCIIVAMAVSLYIFAILFRLISLRVRVFDRLVQ